LRRWRPPSVLLASGGVAVVVEYGADGSMVVPARLRSLDLVTGTTLWVESVNHDVPAFLPRGGGILVLSSVGLIEVGTDGQIANRFTLPRMPTCGRSTSATQGASWLASLDLANGAGTNVVLLDASFAPVWTVPYPWAFGAAADPSGKLLFLSNAMYQLFDPQGYRTLLTK